SGVYRADGAEHAAKRRIEHRRATVGQGDIAGDRAVVGEGRVADAGDREGKGPDVGHDRSVILDDVGLPGAEELDRGPPGPDRPGIVQEARVGLVSEAYRMVPFDDAVVPHAHGAGPDDRVAEVVRAAIGDGAVVHHDRPARQAEPALDAADGAEVLDA